MNGSTSAPSASRRAIGVDGEVAPLEVILDRRVRVDHDLEVVPPGPGRALAARRRELDPRRRQRPQLGRARVEAEADGPSGDDEIVDAPVRRERVAKLIGVEPGDEEVGVLRRAAEQLVADGAADEVRIEPERADVVLDRLHLRIVPADARTATRQASAIASISTSAPDGSFATSTVDRAGGVSPTWRS